MSSGEAPYEPQDGFASEPQDNDYASRPGQYNIPVQKDEAPDTDPIDPATADSDETLGSVEDPEAAETSNL